MNLYKLSVKTEIEYDTYDSCVVCAESEKEARFIHPFAEELEGDEKWWDGEYAEDYIWQWSKPEDLTVEFLGVAKMGMAEGLILASYNAG